jgi:hypothetical protein
VVDLEEIEDLGDKEVPLDLLDHLLHHHDLQAQVRVQADILDHQVQALVQVIDHTQEVDHLVEVEVDFLAHEVVTEDEVAEEWARELMQVDI